MRSTKDALRKTSAWREVDPFGLRDGVDTVNGQEFRLLRTDQEQDLIRLALRPRTQHASQSADGIG
jgi:hypothetical protein